MADITTDISDEMMLGAAEPAQRPRSVKKRGVEFYIYFTLIFILAIPVGFERTIASIIRKRSLDTRGPIARAWADADRITPLIFSA